MTSLLDQEMKKILLSAKSIAVVGHSDKYYRTSYQIASYLRDVGYRVIPVNPKLKSIDGEICFPDLASVDEKIDVVNVFRRSEYLLDIVKESKEINANAVWSQLGVFDPMAREFALANQVELIMNQCIMVEHRRLV